MKRQRLETVKDFLSRAMPPLIKPMRRAGCNALYNTHTFNIYTLNFSIPASTPLALAGLLAGRLPPALTSSCKLA